MRSRKKIFCSGLMGSVALCSLLVDVSWGQQTQPNGAIELQLNPGNTSRRAQLDLFNLKRREPVVPHYTAAPQPTLDPLTATNPATQPTGLVSEVEAWDTINLFDNRGFDSIQDPPVSGDAEGYALGDEASPSDAADEQFAEPNRGASQDTRLNPDQSRPLSVNVVAVNIDTSSIGRGELPEGASRTEAPTRGLPTGIERGAQFVCVHWQPSLVQHYPLYFEDAMLERHGHVRWGHLQSIASGIKFYSTIPMLPYLRTLRPKHECIYQVGHYRVGSCAPLLKDHVPYDKHAAVVEGLSLAGFFWAMPL